MFATQNLILIGGLIVLAAVLAYGSRLERWQRARARLRRDRLAKITFAILCLYAAVAIIDSIVLDQWTPYGQRMTALDWFFRNVPIEKSYSAPLASTTFEITRPEPLIGRHLLGTDGLGKDVLLQTLKGARTALVIGGLTSLIYIPLGTLLGILAGYFKGRVDDAIQYIYTTFASIPEILLLVSILLVIGKGLTQMSIALGVTAWVGLCRLIRGETLRQAERPYCEAARALGQSRLKIIGRHVLPNVMHLVLISFVLGFSGMVLAESILSYLGVGAPIGAASWGVMIDNARMELSREPVVWWNLAGATSALFLLVLSLNLFGESLRRAFDPRSH